LRLALGTVQFGMPYGISNLDGQVTREEAQAMLQLALESGIDTLDTAIGYGESEQVLGMIGVSNFKVVSKLLPLPESVKNVKEWVQYEVQSSLMRLKIPKLHGLLLHRSADLNNAKCYELFTTMQKLKASGLVEKIGISIYSPIELDTLFDKFDFDIVQAPLNIIDRRLFKSGWLHALKKSGCEIHVRSCFLQGLLLMPREDIPRKFSKWDALWDRWHTWLAQHDMNAVHACLAYPLSFPEIDRVVVGALNIAQLQKIAHAAGQAPVASIPDLACQEENLINPAKWSAL